MSTELGYFVFVPKSDDSKQHMEPNEVICKICFKEISSLHNPIRIADSNTSNLHSHLHVHRNPFTIESSHGYHMCVFSHCLGH